MLNNYIYYKCKLTWEEFSQFIMASEMKKTKKFACYQETPTILETQKNFINKLFYLKDLRKMCACAIDNSIQVWEVKNYSSVTQLYGHSAPILDISTTRIDL